MFSKGSMENVSKCCGKKYTMRVIRTVVYASGETIELQTPGQPLEETPVCCGCREPTRPVLKGEEMKPTDGGVYCQTCVRRLTKSKRVPKGLVLRYPVSNGSKEMTCWGCGKTVGLEGAVEMVKEE